MHRTTKRAAKIAAFAAVAFVASATVANASVTIDTTARLRRQGRVQTAFGLNNPALQKDVDKPHVHGRAARVPGSLSQERHPGQPTQAGTQSVSQDVTCTVTNGAARTKAFHRDGACGTARATARVTAPGAAPVPGPSPATSPTPRLTTLPRSTSTPGSSSRAGRARRRTRRPANPSGTHQRTATGRSATGRSTTA